MNISDKVKCILEASKNVKSKTFSFYHENKGFVLDLSESKAKLYNKDEYNEVKRKSQKLAKYKKAKADKVLWIDSDGNELGYGEEGRLKSIESL